MIGLVIIGMIAAALILWFIEEKSFKTCSVCTDRTKCYNKKYWVCEK